MQAKRASRKYTRSPSANAEQMDQPARSSATGPSRSDSHAGLLSLDEYMLLEIMEYLEGKRGQANGLTVAVQIGAVLAFSRIARRTSILFRRRLMPKCTSHLGTEGNAAATIPASIRRRLPHNMTATEVSTCAATLGILQRLWSTVVAFESLLSRPEYVRSSSRPSAPWSRRSDVHAVDEQAREMIAVARATARTEEEKSMRPSLPLDFALFSKFFKHLVLAVWDVEPSFDLSLFTDATDGDPPSLSFQRRDAGVHPDDPGPFRGGVWCDLARDAHGGRVESMARRYFVPAFEVGNNDSSGYMVRLYVDCTGSAEDGSPASATYGQVFIEEHQDCYWSGPDSLYYFAESWTEAFAVLLSAERDLVRVAAEEFEEVQSIWEKYFIYPLFEENQEGAGAADDANV
ncbi:hypothetical protein HK101_002321 [Irineochytrium annulatum]|nr:hypothetical protein HK101_002321 [Irineochytrium annulatum]